MAIKKALFIKALLCRCGCGSVTCCQGHIRRGGSHGFWSLTPEKTKNKSCIIYV